VAVIFNVALAPLATSEASVQIPVLLSYAVPRSFETYPKPAGNKSFTVTFVAGFKPLFVTVIVNKIFVPATGVVLFTPNDKDRSLHKTTGLALFCGLLGALRKKSVALSPLSTQPKPLRS